MHAVLLSPAAVAGQAKLASGEAPENGSLDAHIQVGLPVVEVASRAFERVRMTSGAYDEKWLQRLLFEHPALVPLEEVEHGAGDVVMLCRELPLARASGAVSLDLLGVTRSGRLVLIECKLWRNPQARREVVAQILEYASLLKGWSHADLTARLKSRHGWTDANPIYRLARQQWPDLDEARFVDAISASLERADFHLVIAGDGIRSDAHALTAHLNNTSAPAARLSLIEIQLWSSAATGQTIVLPSVTTRTQIIEQRLITNATGEPLRVREILVDGITQGTSEKEAAAEIERDIDPDQAKQREKNRAFWNRFIAEARFDHPEQTTPAHGGNNWVKLKLEEPFGWLTVYRTNGRMGIFLGVNERIKGIVEVLETDLAGMRAESGLDLELTITSTEPLKGDLVVRCPTEHLSEDEQLARLLDHANRMVTLLRPRLSTWRGELTESME
jgi:hypothetical protein